MGQYVNDYYLYLILFIIKYNLKQIIIIYKQDIFYLNIIILIFL